MEQVGIGAGMAVLAFWGFIAAVVGFGIWHDIRRREARHETLRRMMESGQPIDQQMLNRLLGGDKRLDRNMRAGGIIVLFAAPGLFVLGWLLSLLAGWVLMPMTGVAVLSACIGVGLLVAARAIEGSYRDDQSPTSK